MLEYCLEKDNISILNKQNDNEPIFPIALAILYRYIKYCNCLMDNISNSTTWIEQLDHITKWVNDINRMHNENFKNYEEVQKIETDAKHIEWGEKFKNIVHYNQQQSIKQYFDKKYLFILHKYCKWYRLKPIIFAYGNSKIGRTKMEESITMMANAFNMEVSIKQLDLESVMVLANELQKLNPKSFWEEYTLLDYEWQMFWWNLGS